VGKIKHLLSARAANGYGMYKLKANAKHRASSFICSIFTPARGGLVQVCNVAVVATIDTYVEITSPLGNVAISLLGSVIVTPTTPLLVPHYACDITNF
jgi:hypothetical protein